MKVPDTSLAAYKQAGELIETHEKKILLALSKIGKGNYEQIAEMAGIDKIACMRRMKKLERDQKVYRPGTKSELSTGRKGRDYKLITFSDHAANLLNLTQGKLL